MISPDRRRSFPMKSWFTWTVLIIAGLAIIAATAACGPRHDATPEPVMVMTECIAPPISIPDDCKVFKWESPSITNPNVYWTRVRACEASYTMIHWICGDTLRTEKYYWTPVLKEKNR